MPLPILSVNSLILVTVITTIIEHHNAMKSQDNSNIPAPISINTQNTFLLYLRICIQLSGGDNFRRHGAAVEGDNEEENKEKDEEGNTIQII